MFFKRTENKSCLKSHDASFFGSWLRFLPRQTITGRHQFLRSESSVLQLVVHFNDRFTIDSLHRPQLNFSGMDGRGS